MHILKEPELDELAQGHLAREGFGPQSDMPYLVIDLTSGSPEHAGWLSNLPCPVIGIGKGGLSDTCDVILTDHGSLPNISKNIEKSPLAAMVLVQHLRASEKLSLTDALIAESFAYATLQNGPEFQCWSNSYEGRSGILSPSEPVRIEPHENGLSILLNDSENYNAIGTVMRDALCEALDLALADQSIKTVYLSANGKAFSTGGAVEEFGQVSDPATAHWVRSLRLPAWRCARLTERLHVHVDGAAIGAGAEIAAFGSRVTATCDAWFQLPELKYGLIPGAGGTASLPRRIGRQRTAFMALSMKRIGAQTALEWGLVDEIVS